MNYLQALAACRRKSLTLATASLAALALVAAARASHWPFADWLLGLMAGLGLGGIAAAVMLWFMPDTSDAVPAALSRRYVRDCDESKVAMLWVFPSLCFSYGVVNVFIARHYG